MALHRPLDRFVQTFNRGRDGLRCDRCRGVLHQRHRHLIELEGHRLLCACDACTWAASTSAASTSAASRDGLGSQRVVPEAVRTDPDWSPSWQRWDSFRLPLRLAFSLWLSRRARWVTVVPSAAGALAVELPYGVWSEFLKESRVAQHVIADVEAILFRGIGGGPIEAYVVPLDVCYELVALVRQTWYGVDGGDAARSELDRFFERLRRRIVHTSLQLAAGN